MKQLDLDVLEMVVAVADTGSFVGAATSLRRSPSAISMRIKALEEALGKSVFVRTTRTVSLTHDGSRLVAYGRRMLAMREEAWATVVQPDIRGRVTIGVSDDCASLLLPAVLRKFATAHPRVQIRVIGMTSRALASALKDNTVDLACTVKTRDIAGDQIRLEPVVWTARSGHLSIWKERPLPIAVPAHGDVVRMRAISALKLAGIPYRISCESVGLQSLICMARAGMAVAPLVRFTVPADLAQLGAVEGLPPIDALEFVLARSVRSDRAPCDMLANQILAEL
ncbi:LysR substrate-binding domain-containing protein [Burkholderia sp. Bp9142]|uniref:LysR substrate-binding domain-containing protein n=1 Tax=Burkholderia sp. Bp9142 TaxID=2184573 RepID=UPI000F5B0AF3|nr:LysR substrate-binding domain-containing protein [Burkholderia sp. Bp9142]RQR26496.1 LysR family transcriptional regulator [Burkholderia sp. Bp9142]